jgi:hypothetical protein
MTDQELSALAQQHCIRESAIASLIHLLQQVRISRAEMKTSARCGSDRESNSWAYCTTLRIETEVLGLLLRGLERAGD